MPILKIQALPQRPDVDVSAVLQATCVALADAMQLPADQVWGTWHEMPVGRYVVGTAAPPVQPPATHPPLVELLALEGRTPELKARMLECLGDTLSAQLHLQPGNVYVRYVEMPRATVYSDGKVLAR